MIVIFSWKKELELDLLGKKTARLLFLLEALFHLVAVGMKSAVLHSPCWKLISWPTPGAADGALEALTFLTAQQRCVTGALLWAQRGAASLCCASLRSLSNEMRFCSHSAFQLCGTVGFRQHFLPKEMRVQNVLPSGGSRNHHSIPASYQLHMLCFERHIFHRTAFPELSVCHKSSCEWVRSSCKQRADPPTPSLVLQTVLGFDAFCFVTAQVMGVCVEWVYLKVLRWITVILWSCSVFLCTTCPNVIYCYLGGEKGAQLTAQFVLIASPFSVTRPNFCLLLCTSLGEVINNTTVQLISELKRISSVRDQSGLSRDKNLCWLNCFEGASPLTPIKLVIHGLFEGAGVVGVLHITWSTFVLSL